MKSDARLPKPKCHLQRTTPTWADLAAPAPGCRMRLIQLAHETDFEGWRRAARGLRGAGVPPQQVRWIVGDSSAELFGEAGPPAGPVTSFNVPREFVEMAEQVICHRA